MVLLVFIVVGILLFVIGYGFVGIFKVSADRNELPVIRIVAFVVGLLYLIVLIYDLFFN